MPPTRTPVRAIKVACALSLVAVAVIPAVRPAAAAFPKCFGKLATIGGTGGADRIVGTPGDDVIVGRGGKDVIKGGGGNDRICGENGNDKLRGGDGDDQIAGGSGSDMINGGGGADIISGDSGRDTLSGGSGADHVVGAGGDDQVAGGKHNDILNGGGDNDTLNGNGGNDILSGGTDDDSLNGGVGDDSANGGSGVDACTNALTLWNCEADVAARTSDVELHPEGLLGSDSVTLPVTVTNKGPSPVDALVLTVTTTGGILPWTPTTLDGAAIPIGTCLGSPLVCNLPGLASGESLEVEGTVSVLGCTPGAATVEFLAVNATHADRAPGNNDATSNISIDPAPGCGLPI